MENEKKSFLQLLCTFYMIAILAVLPLYTGGTYWKIGDTKYLLFRNVSYLCLGICAMVALFAKKKSRTKWSLVDGAMIFYGGCVLLSALFSEYTQTAWMGSADWYMGAISQLLFVGVYFMVSRCAAGNVYPIYAGEAAILIVSVIAILHRFWIDPLRLMKGFFWVGDWESSHMLSTIGNINWLCGYYSVALALPVAGYLYSKTVRKRNILYGISVLGLLVLCMQGSDSGYLIAGGCIGVCLLTGLHRQENFYKGLLLTGGTFFLLPLFGQLTVLRKTTEMFPIDGNTFEKVTWNGWWILAAIFILMAVIMQKMTSKTARLLIRVLLILGMATAVVAAIIYVWKVPFGNTWGSSRGRLWKLALQGFWQGDWKQKLIGAGPDCFGEYIEEMAPRATVLFGSGRWAGATFTNAHNEWLNALVNLGVCGVLGYLSIFVTAAGRYRRMPLALLVLSMYGINSLFSFQQAVNTPLLFLVFGLCESRVRHAENAELFDKALTDGLQSS